MSKSRQSVSPDGPDTEPATKEKARRIVSETSEEVADVASRTRALGSAATDSISGFVAARPLASIAVVFCLGLFIGRRRSR